MILIYGSLEKASNPPLVHQFLKGAFGLAVVLCSVPRCFAFAQASSVPDIFKPASTPAESIHRLSLFVLVITARQPILGRSRHHCT
jgi:hypothetical protein